MLYYRITAHKGFIKNLNLIQHTLFHIYTDEHKIIQRTKKKIYDNHQVKKKYIYSSSHANAYVTITYDGPYMQIVNRINIIRFQQNETLFVL